MGRCVAPWHVRGVRRVYVLSKSGLLPGRADSSVLVTAADAVGDPFQALSHSPHVVVVAALNAIPYFTSATAMGTFTSTAYGRGLVGLTDQAAARAALGLGTAVIANVTTSASDATAGRVLKVGDFGLSGPLLRVAP